MSKSGQIYMLCGVIFVFGYIAGSSAHAVEKLQYGTNPPPPILHKLSKIPDFKDQKASDLSYAMTDLNEDGIAEIIIRPSKCDAIGQICTYHIFADMTDSLMTLDTIDARDIAIGNEHVSGVRNLLVFKNQLNDFDYDVYTWNAKDRNYEHLR